MVVSMVAPKLSHFDLWVHPLSESDDDGDVEGFLELLAQPLQATTNGAPLPNVISVSYGDVRVDRHAVHRVADARRAPADRDRRARHHDRGRGRRHRLVGVRARRPGHRS